MNREMELEKLIAEQARDMRGTFQAPEKHCVPMGLLEEFLTPDGRVKLPDVVGSREWELGCTIHGHQETTEDLTRGGGFRCRACDRQRKADKRQVDGDRMRALDRARKARA